MATQFCEKCKQAHPGRICDYDDDGECTPDETTASDSGDAGPKEEVNKQ